MDRTVLTLYGILIVVSAIGAWAIIVAPPLSETIASVEDLEKACADSGGIITTASCCNSVGDFPNTCLVGACGCSPDNSHQVTACDCGTGRCFNGVECTPIGQAA